MSAHSIVGTTWVVREIGGEPTGSPQPEIVFGDEGRLTGTTSVNRLMGGYEVDGAQLVFAGGTATTRMAGPPEMMRQEQGLAALLTGSVPFELDGGRLVLGSPDAGGPGHAVLERVAGGPDDGGSSAAAAQAGETDQGLAQTSPAQTPGAENG
jgi:heat shock protein HslJ